MAQLLFESRDEENAVAVQMPIGIVAFVVPRDPQHTKSSDPTFLKVSNTCPDTALVTNCWLHASCIEQCHR